MRIKKRKERRKCFLFHFLNRNSNIKNLFLTFCILPINIALAKIWSFIASSNCFLFAVDLSGRELSSAYNLKKYLCVPDGGQGPP